MKEIIDLICRIKEQKGCVIVAIDGRCASGKTTLAARIKEEIGCNVISVDSFFLRPVQRTAERYAQPGGNMDRERLLSEVLLPLKNGGAFSYRPYNCHAACLGEPVEVSPNAVTIIEGTYSCHPDLWEFYDLHIFLTVPQKEQIERLKKRNESMLSAFTERWIPLEEAYFSHFNIGEKCEIKIDTQI